MSADESPARESQAAFCRTRENDAANCLYLQLRLIGYRGRYGVFRDQLPADPASLTLKEMVEVGRRLGFRHRPLKLTISDLMSTKGPVILHLEDHGVNSGQFMLFLWMYDDETKVALIDGTNVTFREMSRDEFRRSWSGYALIVDPPVDWAAWILRSAVAIVCTVLCCWLVLRIDGSGGWLASCPGDFKLWNGKLRERLNRRNALDP